MGSNLAIDLDQAARSFDRAAATTAVTAAAERAEQIRADFQLDEWPSLTLERYAIGHPDYKSSFCHRLEFASPELGSISGGSSRKLIIYGRADGSGWYYDPAFPSVEAAWEAVRAGFVSAFDLAKQGKIAEVDDIVALRSGPALTGKALYVYFTDQVLPIYSQSHVRHFIENLTREKP